MQGADKYYDLIYKAYKSKLGELYKVNCLGYGDGYKFENIIFILSEHARGKTFRIWIYKTDAILSTLNDEHLEVYGVTGGNPGWTEMYGWTKDGNWKPYIERYFTQLEENIKKTEKYERIREEKIHEANKNKEHLQINKFNEIFTSK
jgi:hypothetical protein